MNLKEINEIICKATIKNIEFNTYKNDKSGIYPKSEWGIVFNPIKPVNFVSYERALIWLDDVDKYTTEEKNAKKISTTIYK